MATSYDDAEHRIVGSSAMSAIDSLNRNKTRLEPASPFKSLRPRLRKILLCLHYPNIPPTEPTRWKMLYAAGRDKLNKLSLK